MPAAKKSVPVNTMSMSLRPAPCIAFSLPGNSGAGALVELTLAISSGCFFWKSSMASCVNARSPATSTMLSVTGLPFGACASAPSGIVEAALEFLDHSRQVPMHRKPCAGGVVRRDGANDRGMVANRLLGKVGRMKVLLHPSPEFGELIPQTFDD